MVNVRRTWLTLLIVSMTALPVAASSVRALSDAERAAVDHAAAYLSGGPDAIVQRLSASSPLGKLPAAEAAKEIEVRLGPPSGATWELQTVVPALRDKVAVFDIAYPSGVDETAIFELSKSGDTYKIDNLRILAEEASQKPIFPPPPASDDKPVETKFPADKVAFGLCLAACAVAVAASFMRRGNKDLVRIAIPVSAMLAIGAVSLALLAGEHTKLVTPPHKADSAAASVKDNYPRLASLLDLRRALASGSETKNMSTVAAHSDTARDVAKLWKAQMDLQQVRIDDAKRTLKSFPVPSSIPLVEILRGRLALFEQDESASAVAYEHAVSLGPGRDGLWSETAHALLALGYEDRCVKYLDRLDRIGSRDADVYYILSMFRAFKDKEEESQKLLNTAWSLHPAQRSQVIGIPILWSVIRKPETASFINLSAPDEAAVASPSIGTRAIALPLNAVAKVAGDFLDIQIGEQELRVPGGACLAPAGTQPVDAASWSRTEEEKYVADYARLVSVAGTAGAYTQPALRRRITGSALALAERNRWNDIIKLTDGLSPKSEYIPPTLFFLRATALQRAQRAPEAKELLVSLAAGHVLQRKRDAQSLEQLGEMLASFDLFDAAVKMLDRAEQIRQNERIEYTVARINMNKRLATKYSTLDSEHFQVHYPEDVNAGSAKLIDQILEDELKRMQTWIPTAVFKPVVVNVVWWQDFRSTITGNDFIIGLYQGKITVPLAGLPFYPPEIVAILTHELTHAMLAQATNDQAPHWFQEGMAKRMEMTGMTRNAFNMYDDNKLLAFSLLDSVLRDSPDPDMIGEGYLESEAVVRYVEAKYGKAGLTKMVEQFRDGATTDEAIERVAGMPVVEFDRQFRQWGRSERRFFETPIVARYDMDEEPEIRLKNGAKATTSQAEPPVNQQAAPRGALRGGTFYPLKKP